MTNSANWISLIAVQISGVWTGTKVKKLYWVTDGTGIMFVYLYLLVHEIISSNITPGYMSGTHKLAIL